MPSVSELEWENQNSITSYPFMQNAPVNGVIVDASFQQFNNFIPTLNYILVSQTSLTVNVTYDTGTANFTLQQTDYDNSLNYIRLTAGTRYIGRITFGTGVTTLWSSYLGQKLIYLLPFAATTVRSIDPNSGVFSFNSLHGAVTITRVASDENLFFNTATSSNRNQVTFNAVKNNQFPAISPAQALKKINLVSPIDNNIFISTSDIVQINGNGIGAINVSLVGSSSSTLLTNLQPIATTLGF